MLLLSLLAHSVEGERESHEQTRFLAQCQGPGRIMITIVKTIVVNIIMIMVVMVVLVMVVAMVTKPIRKIIISRLKK